MELQRRYYTEEKPIDITIIEIISSDGIDVNSFLEIDESILNIDKKKFSDKDIYIIHYPKGDKISFSTGKIKRIKENSIYHSCSTESGSSGAPILDVNTFKILGVHKGCNQDFNLGSLIIKPIEKINMINKNKIINNEIKNNSNILYKNNNNNNNNDKNNNCNILIYSQLNNNNILNNSLINDEITIQYSINNNIINKIFEPNIKIFG